MAPNIIEVRQSDERSRQLSFGDMNVHRQAGDREFLHIRFHGEVRLMQQNVVRTQQRKTPHPVENQPGHLEFPRRFRRPGQTFVRYNAARRRIVFEISLQRRLWNAVEILAEFREPHLLAGEWDFQEVNFQAGSPEIPRESRRVLRGGYQANFRAVAGQQPGHVDHGNHVALRQQRD
nr:Os01g0176150 [Ipomoea batatas]